MKKLKSHDDLEELRVGDLTTWHLAVDTSDATSGPLSAALWRLQHNDIEAGGKKKGLQTVKVGFPVCMFSVRWCAFSSNWIF